ncbi:unnamed protein product, partial [Rotaria sp. Silwood2]
NVDTLGDIKLFEKELLNLPLFQLSDSQNPLLPSPTCLSYDFPTQFYQTNQTDNNNIIKDKSSTSNIIRHSNNSLSNSLEISKHTDDH